VRILAISHLFPNVGNKHFGIFSARQFTAMQDLGAEVVVFVPTVWVPGPLTYFRRSWRDSHAQRSLVEYAGLETHLVPYLRLTRGFWSCRWEGLCVYHLMKERALAMHRQEPFDVIYGKGFFPGADAAIRLSRLLHIPAVGEGIGSDVNVVPDYSRAMYRHFVWVSNALEGAVADGKSVADRISQVSGKTVPTVHGLVDLNIFSPTKDKIAIRCELEVPQNHFIMLYVGGLQTTKGVYEMVEAFCRAQKVIPKMMLKICGTGQEYGKLASLITERRISDSVQLVGAVEVDNVAKWMQASDFLILASYSEGMPNVVMEAMACGLPVIATTVGGLPSAVGDCEGAILVEPKNIEQLELAILKVAKNEHLRKRMEIVARRKAEEQFGSIQNTTKILDYLSLIINEYRKSM
jgi:glycosyltransferase involved in cell wall biosynthesis